MRFFMIALLASLFLLSSCSNRHLPEQCYLQPESGKCRASLMRWNFDERSGTCKGFIWGGCEGVVPFETQESCAAMCMAGQPATVESVQPGLIKQLPPAVTP